MGMIRRVVPRPVRRLARLLVDTLRLLWLEQTYRRRYGRTFVATIHQKDDMFLYLYTGRVPGEAAAAVAYLQSGEAMLREVEGMFADLGRDLRHVDSFLEFACGYGRFTRFLVSRVEAARITVSDIDSRAVRFTCRTFGVDGFVSVADPEDLVHGKSYDVVFVASLFSHLARAYWTPWLKRLAGMLNPGGLLIFSVHGMRPYELMTEAQKRAVEVVEDGFYFAPRNESRGRLPVDYYGSTYVSSEFVRRELASASAGRLIRMFPDTLYQWQDVYVVTRE